MRALLRHLLSTIIWFAKLLVNILNPFLQQLSPNVIHIFDHFLNTLHTLLPDRRVLLLNRRPVGDDVLATLRKNCIQVLALLSGKALRLEQDIHILKLHTLGLRQEEEGESHAHDYGATKEKKHPVFYVGDHIGSRVSDDELAEPLRASCEDQADLADGCRESLGAENPRNTVPRDGVEDCEDVNHDDGEVGPCVASWFFVERVRELGVDAEIVHGENCASRTDQHGRAASEAVDDQEHEDSCAAGFDDAEDACGEQTGVGSLETDGANDDLKGAVSTVSQTLLYLQVLTGL